MDAFKREQLKQWTFSTIESNPNVYGGDASNPEIMKAYAKEFHGTEKVDTLHVSLFSILSTISRFKNKILKANPYLDHRERFAPRVKQ